MIEGKKINAFIYIVLSHVYAIKFDDAAYACSCELIGWNVWWILQVACMRLLLPL